MIDAIPRYSEDCPFLFPARPATRHIDNFGTQWDRIRNEAGLPGLRIHDLRHSWASTAAMNGVDMVTVAKLLGHALVETTERYTHLSDQSVTDAASSLPGTGKCALPRPRRRARDMLNRIRAGGNPADDIQQEKQTPTFREFTQEYLRRCEPRWKPSGHKTVRIYLKARILPAFGRMPLDRIGPEDVAA